MPIDPAIIQSRFAEVGRIRTGKKTAKAMKALDHFRLTSRYKTHLDRAAELWGGRVVKWEGDWEVEIETNILPVVIPPQRVNQWFEFWGRGKGLLRRCDGVTERLSNSACMCNPKKRDCKPTTRLNVLLADIPDIGYWLYTTGSYNAAAEMPATVEFLNRAGGYTNAMLVIEEKERRVRGQVKKFYVPRIQIESSIQEIMNRMNEQKALMSEQRYALGAGTLSAEDILLQEPTTQGGLALLSAMGREGHWPDAAASEDYLNKLSRYVTEKDYEDLTPDEEVSFWMKVWSQARAKVEA